MYVCVLNFFGGCVEIIVLDNLKFGVYKVDFYDLVLNCIYGEMVVYYGMVIILVCSWKFCDKVKVE